jgi:hypothetical protein
MKRRTWAVATVIAAVFAFHTAAASGAGTVTASCTLPSLLPVSCGSWHAASVTLRWSWNPGGELSTSGCQTQTFASDTPPPGPSVTCTVTWSDGFGGKTVTVLVDKTAPVVISATPARPPDHDGWYNHPVAFAFNGSDATSGIASCDTITFGGPGGTLTGGCTDLAGNRGLASFPIQYDSTPPAPARVTEAPGNGSIHLRWVAPPDAARVRVIRMAGGKGNPKKTVYRGSGDAATDRRLKNGLRYRYSVTVFDQAGNATTTRVSSIPTSSPLRPLGGTVVSAPPRLTWRGVHGADYYNVQLFKGNRKILSAWPHGSHLQLRLAWKYRGKHRRLNPGLYRWYVWPGYGLRSAQRYGPRLGGSSFRLRR